MFQAGVSERLGLVFRADWGKIPNTHEGDIEGFGLPGNRDERIFRLLSNITVSLF